MGDSFLVRLRSFLVLRLGFDQFRLLGLLFAVFHREFNEAGEAETALFSTAVRSQAANLQHVDHAGSSGISQSPNCAELTLSHFERSCKYPSAANLSIPVLVTTEDQRDDRQTQGRQPGNRRGN